MDKDLQKSTKQKKKSRNKLKYALIAFSIIGAIIAFMLPGLLSQRYWERPGWDFTKTGEIGDTIGGIAGPILTFISIILIYFSFQQQFEANQILRKDLKRQKKKARRERLLQIISNYLRELKIAIENIDFEQLKKSLEEIIKDKCIEGMGAFNQSISDRYRVSVR